MYQKNTLEPEHRPHSPPGHSHQAPDQKQCRPVWWKHDERAGCLIVGADSYRYRGLNFLWRHKQLSCACTVWKLQMPLVTACALFVLREWKRFPATQFKLFFHPLMYLQLPQLLRRRLVVQVNNWIQKPSRSVTSSSKGGKKMPSSQEGQTKFYPCIWKNDFDNLLQHQKDKDVLGSEISDLKDTLSVTEKIAERSNNQSRRGWIKTWWLRQEHRQVNKGCCEWTNRPRVVNETSKKDQEKLIAELRVEERSQSTAPDTPLIRYRLGRSGKKGTELLSQVERLSQKLSS
jgi:hypothetical protein